MTKARNLKRGDTFPMMAAMKVLSVTPLPGGLIKIKAETENSPSMEFADGGCVLEIICKSYRSFSSFPYRPDNNGGIPLDLEPVG
jgi:hypothetical protein